MWAGAEAMDSTPGAPAPTQPAWASGHFQRLHLLHPTCFPGQQTRLKQMHGRREHSRQEHGRRGHAEGKLGHSEKQTVDRGHGGSLE